MADKKFKLQVMARDGEIFQGEVDSISSYNDEGKFDVLASHANFISLITKGLVVRDADEVKKIDFDNALLRVKKDIVEVYIGVEGLAPSFSEVSSINKETEISIKKN